MFGIQFQTSGIDLAYDASSAKVYLAQASQLEQDGVSVIDLFPAVIGAGVVPPVNMQDKFDIYNNFNTISFAPQITVPIVDAIKRASSPIYVVTASTVASGSVGTGTRQHIDKFTRTANRAQQHEARGAVTW